MLGTETVSALALHLLAFLPVNCSLAGSEALVETFYQ